MIITSTEIIAYLGAAAWLPQIFSWIYNFFVKPTITITPEKSAQIGYTCFGPIFNLRLAINVNKKDTLIDL